MAGMKTRTLLLAILLMVLGAAWLLAQKSQLSGPDPLVVAGDTHKLVFENSLVRVIETHLPPGKREPRHFHPHGVTIYVQGFDVRITEDGKPPVERQRKAGTAVWSEPVVHEVVNVGKTEGHVFRVELKH